jgi:hypothetical protein
MMVGLGNHPLQHQKTTATIPKGSCEQQIIHFWGVAPRLMSVRLSIVNGVFRNQFRLDLNK